MITRDEVTLFGSSLNGTLQIIRRLNAKINPIPAAPDIPMSIISGDFVSGDKGYRGFGTSQINQM